MMGKLVLLTSAVLLVLLQNLDSGNIVPLSFVLWAMLAWGLTVCLYAIVSKTKRR